MHHLPHKYHRKQGTKLPHVSQRMYSLLLNITRLSLSGSSSAVGRYRQPSAWPASSASSPCTRSTSPAWVPRTATTRQSPSSSRPLPGWPGPSVFLGSFSLAKRATRVRKGRTDAPEQWIHFVPLAGIVGHVLNYPFMAPLSRMTYCAYLIHMQLIQVFHFSRKTIMHFDVYFMVSKTFIA